MYLQAAGIRFIGFRNEQAAGYAAAAAGFLTGVPGVLLTVSGPGAVHGIAGLSHAQVNTWPMLMISGSAEQVRFPTLHVWAAVLQLEAYKLELDLVQHSHLDLRHTMTWGFWLELVGKF